MLRPRDAFAAITAVCLLLAAQNMSRSSALGAVIFLIVGVASGALWWGHARRDQRTGR